MAGNLLPYRQMLWGRVISNLLWEHMKKQYWLLIFITYCNHWGRHWLLCLNFLCHLWNHSHIKHKHAYLEELLSKPTLWQDLWSSEFHQSRQLHLRKKKTIMLYQGKASRIAIPHSKELKGLLEKASQVNPLPPKNYLEMIQVSITAHWQFCHWFQWEQEWTWNFIFLVPFKKFKRTVSK